MTTVLEEIQEIKQQEQEQEQEYLTIDQIMPKWSHYLDLFTEERRDYSAIAKYENENDLDMADYARCMAGEAHKFTDNYHYGGQHGFCNSCDHVARRVFPMIFELAQRHHEFFKMRNWRDYSEVKNFVVHWNEEHREAMLRR